MDRSGGGFEYHIKNHHYLWNYFYYIYYILNKDKSDYNGIETYISEKVFNLFICFKDKFKRSILVSYLESIVLVRK